MSVSLILLLEIKSQRIAWALITPLSSGREFQFIKLSKQSIPKYALSYTLSLNRGDDLHTVVKVLKQLAYLIRNS
ncbi:hypothetical protein A6S26_30110 [Nostoc sp. ATCC 43529]|nr:hypothetical protein A6S26_30110 [Nostoc sp. ATCC 43529]